MKFKVNEIFSSIQGEGIFVGSPMNFIRFTRCNLNCEYCDTNFKEGNGMGVGEILERLNKRVKWVSLTGGEPMMEENLISLVKKLKEENYKIFLETNGTFFDEKIFSNSDFISIDLKTPSSGNSYFEKEVFSYALEHPKRTQLKVVIQKEKDLKFFEKLYEGNEDYKNWILQPEWSFRKKLNYKEIIYEFPKVRIIPQVHKILKVR
jgi:7-carboxy-7-deazaguanine synthase